jgi:hypothetical protein
VIRTFWDWRLLDLAVVTKLVGIICFLVRSVGEWLDLGGLFLSDSSFYLIGISISVI